AAVGIARAPADPGSGRALEDLRKPPVPLGVQRHLPHWPAEMVQHAQLRQPGEGGAPSRPPQGGQHIVQFPSPARGGGSGWGLQCTPGGVSERFKVRLSKSRVAATPPRVRISPPPPDRSDTTETNDP